MRSDNDGKAKSILRFVEEVHGTRHVPREMLFDFLEQAMAMAARKNGDGYDDSLVEVHINRNTGEINAYRDGVPLTPEEITERAGAQTAKQIFIQKIRDAERDMNFDKFYPRIGTLVNGTVSRGGDRNKVVSVALEDGGVDAIMPHSERIPREKFQTGDKITALIVDVKKNGAVVKVILSRSRPLLVQRIFEQEIPEIVDGTICIKNVSRDAGRRTKVAVYSDDPRIDLVGACVGVRGARSSAINKKLGGGERVDVVPYSEEPTEFIRSALKPAEIEEIILCEKIGRAIVLVQPECRAVAIGNHGQNVRLASRLTNWDIDVMTREDLDKMIEKATEDFLSIEGITAELANVLVGQGYLSYSDLSIIEPEDLVALGRLSEEQVNYIVQVADERAEEEENARENNMTLLNLQRHEQREEENKGDGDVE